MHSPLSIAFLFAAVVLWAPAVVSRSNEYGKNPQHDFGSISGRKVNPVLPFWTMLGDTFANEDFIRLTPDRQSKIGAVWNSQRLNWKNWEILIKSNVNGNGAAGADGWGLWLAKEVNVIGGFYGFVEQFNGIGVVVDTYDNDNDGMHPMVTVLKNDGRKTYDHSHAGGKHKASDMELGHCSFNVRNRNSNTLMKVKYYKNQITVEIRLEDEEDWKECVKTDTIIDNTNLYLGLSAATGHLADNHDIYGVSIRNLDDDAQFYDSESRFAQFSKYSIAESLGRIQADIRGSAYAGKNPTQSPPAASTGGKVTAKIDDSLRQELAGLRRDISGVIDALNQQPSNDRDRIQQNSYGNSGSNNAVQQAIEPLQRTAKDLRSVEESMKRNVGDLSGETKKLNHIQGKVDRLINSLETKERNQGMKSNRNNNEDVGSIFSIFNIIFFLVCAVCIYLGVTLFRIKNKGSGHIKV